jgi:hypothetical protein
MFVTVRRSLYYVHVIIVLFVSFAHLCHRDVSLWRCVHDTLHDELVFAINLGCHLLFVEKIKRACRLMSLGAFNSLHTEISHRWVLQIVQKIDRTL